MTAPLGLSRRNRKRLQRCDHRQALADALCDPHFDGVVRCRCGASACVPAIWNADVYSADQNIVGLADQMLREMPPAIARTRSVA